MKLRTLTSALLIAGVSATAQAEPQQPVFTTALDLEERFAYSLIEAMLSLVAMNVEHTGKCSAYYDANVTVSNNGDIAYAEIDDVKLYAVDVTDPFGLTKGTKLHVYQYDNGVNELGDVDVADMSVYSAYDYYGTMAGMDGYVYLDDDLFDEHIIKDFWEVDEYSKDLENEDYLGHSIVLDYGYELITKFGYPRAKYDQFSYLWRSNGGNGYLLIEKHLIAPDPDNNPCWITYTALVGDFAGGFQTIGGEIVISDD